MPIYGDQVPGLLVRQQCQVGLVLNMLVTEAAKAPISRYQNAALGHFVIAVAVNAKSPVHTLGLAEVGRIFSGELAAWSEIARSGLAVGIEAYRPPGTSTESLIFQRKAMQGRAFSNSPPENLARPEARVLRARRSWRQSSNGPTRSGSFFTGPTTNWTSGSAFWAS